MARRPRLPGVNVRPGALKQARVEAGLSLAQLAGAELSRTAIHLFECGKARPSRRTLELIASRTGRPVSYFTTETGAEVHAEVDALCEDIERAFMRRELEEAARLCEELLGKSASASAHAYAQYYFGRCLIAQTRPEAAKPHFEAALAHYRARGDDWMSVECMQGIAKALFQLEDGAALAVAQEALRLCRSLDPLPEQTMAQLLDDIGAIHVIRHEWTQAIDTYEQAAEAAGSLRDLRRAALVYDNLSIVYQEVGNLTMAADCSRRATSLLSLERNQGTLARAENNLALVLLRQGNFAEAEKHLQRALRLCAELHLDHGRAHVLLSLAEVNLNQGLAEQASAYARDAAALAHALGERLSEALAHQYLGTAAAAEHDFARSDAEFDTALSLLEAAESPERLVECHVAYARALRTRGETERALVHFEAALGTSRPHLSQPSEIRYLMVG